MPEFTRLPMDGSPTKTLPFTDLRRTMVAVGLVGIALIHLLDLQSKMEETPYLGWLFVALIVASLVLADLLLRRGDALYWAAATALSTATFAGYVVSRTVGLPGQPEDDIGNWGEPLGLASLLVEAIVAVVALEVVAASWGRAGRTAR